MRALGTKEMKTTKSSWNQGNKGYMRVLVTKVIKNTKSYWNHGYKINRED